MSALRRIALFSVAALCSLPAAAVNRCVLPNGHVVYTDATCESLGGRLDRAVSREISVVPPQPGAAPQAPKGAPARQAPDAARPGPAFQKAANAPVMRVCYDPQDARKEVTQPEVEAAIREAIALWNAGCNLTYEFVGSCPLNNQIPERPIDYKVWWASWDDTMQSEGKTFRDHAIAAASPRIGVALNRDVESAAFQRQWRRSIAHEFGHVAGIGHSGNRADLMYSGGQQPTPTAADLAACNQAIERRFGVKAAVR
jgi:hypothetical protein